MRDVLTMEEFAVVEKAIKFQQSRLGSAADWKILEPILTKLRPLEMETVRISSPIGTWRISLKGKAGVFQKVPGYTSTSILFT